MIDPVILGYLGLVIMLGLIFVGVPICYSMAGVATVGITLVTGIGAAASQNMLLAWEQGSSFVLSSIPLFILMGTLANNTNIVADLFDTVRKWVGHVPGGLAVAGVLASAGFGAVTGSTAAACATMGKTIMPELSKSQYDGKLSTATLAASGGLAAVIPPSVFLIVYCVLTDNSIGTTFIAVFVPGLLITGIYSAYLIVRCALNPALGPRGPVHSWEDRFKCLGGSVPVMMTFLIVIGGMYGGIFTPTEAASVGVVGVAVIALVMRRLNRENFIRSLRETGQLSTVIFLIIFGGWLMSRFLVTTGTTKHMVDSFVGMGMPLPMLIISLTVFYTMLGMALEPCSILILTMPFVYPVTLSYGIDPVWFGVYMTFMMVLGGITPPVGVNVYILNGVWPSVSSKETFAAAFPYMIMLLFMILLLYFFPSVATWLPNSMA